MGGSGVTTKTKTGHTVRRPELQVVLVQVAEKTPDLGEVDRVLTSVYYTGDEDHGDDVYLATLEGRPESMDDGVLRELVSLCKEQYKRGHDVGRKTGAAGERARVLAPFRVFAGLLAEAVEDRRNDG